MPSPICSSHALNISVMPFEINTQPVAFRAGEKFHETGKNRKDKIRKKEGEEDDAGKEIECHEFFKIYAHSRLIRPTKRRRSAPLLMPSL